MEASPTIDTIPVSNADPRPAPAWRASCWARRPVPAKATHQCAPTERRSSVSAGTKAASRPSGWKTGASGLASSGTPPAVQGFQPGSTPAASSGRWPRAGTAACRSRRRGRSRRRRTGASAPTRRPAPGRLRGAPQPRRGPPPAPGAAWARRTRCGAGQQDGSGGLPPRPYRPAGRGSIAARDGGSAPRERGASTDPDTGPADPEPHALPTPPSCASTGARAPAACGCGRT